MNSIADSKAAAKFASKLNKNSYLAEIKKESSGNLWTITRNGLPWKEIVISYCGKGKWLVNGRNSLKSFSLWICNSQEAEGWLMGNLQACK